MILGRRLPGVGTVTFDSIDQELRLALSHPSLSVRGAVTRDGAIVLDGSTTGSDTPAFVTGTAQIAEVAGILRIEGMLAYTIDESSGFPFVMERPIGTDGSGASGRYRLDFVASPGPCRCASTVELDLRIESDGRRRRRHRDSLHFGTLIVRSRHFRLYSQKAVLPS